MQMRAGPFQAAARGGRELMLLPSGRLYYEQPVVVVVFFSVKIKWLWNKHGYEIVFIFCSFLILLSTGLIVMETGHEQNFFKVKNNNQENPT